MAFRASLFGLTALVTVTGALAGGCTYHEEEGVSANGEQNQLAFSATSGSYSALGAVGFARTITVSRYGPTTITCHGLGGSSKSDLHISGGSLPPDKCTTRVPDAITLVSATCTGDACTVTSEADGPSITLHVTGKTAGATHLVVSVIETSDGTKYDDSIALELAVPSRIAVSTLPGELAALRMPALVGVEMGWPSGRVVDDAGRSIEIENSPLSTKLEGDAYEETKGQYALDTVLVARRAGHGAVHFSLPGLLDRKVDLEVVDPADARSLVVYAPAPLDTLAPGGVDLDDAQGDPETSGGRVTSLTIESGSYDTTTFPTRVQLADGRMGVAHISSIAVVPSTLAMAMLGDTLGSFELYSGTTKAATTTTGSVTLRIDGGGPTFTLPLTASPKAAARASR